MVQTNLSAVQEPVGTNNADEKCATLVRGGPFYRAQEAVRLLDANRWNLGRRILLAVAVGWVPLIVLTFIFNRPAVLGLIRSYSINSRLLIAIPVMLIGQPVMENIFRKVVRHIGEARLLLPQDSDYIDRTIVKLIRLRVSFIPELIIVLAVYLHVLFTVRGQLTLALPWAVISTGGAFQISPAGWYYALVSELLYQLLLGIGLWTWFLWSAFLFQLSRLDMQLIPTHPDKHGGVGFLGMSAMALAPTAFAASVAIGATWRLELLRGGLHLMDLKVSAAALLLILLIIGVGPLAFFVPKLSKLRRNGILEYGILGQIHSKDFDDKWIKRRAEQQENFLVAPEISTLTDFGTSFENIEQMVPFPFDKGGFVALILAYALPMFPVILAQIPLREVIIGLLHAVK